MKAAYLLPNAFRPIMKLATIVKGEDQILNSDFEIVSPYIMFHRIPYSDNVI